MSDIIKPYLPEQDSIHISDAEDLGRAISKELNNYSFNGWTFRRIELPEMPKFSFCPDEGCKINPDSIYLIFTAGKLKDRINRFKESFDTNGSINHLTKGGVEFFIHDAYLELKIPITSYEELTQYFF